MRSAKEISLFGKESDYKLLAVTEGGGRVDSTTGVCCRFWRMSARGPGTGTEMYKYKISISIVFSINILIRNENITSEERKIKICLK